MLDNLRQKKQFKPLCIGLVAAVLMTTIWVWGIKTPAYAVYIDGKETFTVKSKSEVEAKLQELQKQEEKSSQVEMALGSKVEFKRVLASRGDLLAEEDLLRELKGNLQFQTAAVAIVADGKRITCLKEKKDAEALLAQLKKEYGTPGEGEKLLEVSFAEKVELKEVKVTAKDITTAKQAYDLITTGTPNPEKYAVQDGDCLWLIARRNDMYVDDIVKANHLETEKLSLGQELILVKSKPCISVMAKVEGEKTEVIPYTTKVITDSNATSSIRVTQAGKDGEKHIAYIATRTNGTVTKQEVTKEEILQEPVEKVLVKGTKVVQVASRGGGGTGELDWPAYGPISQYYKSYHRAIDIAGKRGSAITAADSGYVTFAGWQGGYGNLIVVDHGNGMVTRYAHCDAFVASVGQKVSKGQTIAKLGNTGRSTGPHLHFEVIVYGSYKNPLNYLR